MPQRRIELTGTLSILSPNNCSATDLLMAIRKKVLHTPLEIQWCFLFHLVFSTDIPNRGDTDFFFLEKPNQDSYKWIKTFAEYRF